MNNQNKPIILFDGVCNLCNSSVNLVLKYDNKNHFRFASLQSDAAKQLLLQYRITNLDNMLDSIVLIDQNKFYYQSTAALFIAKKLKFPINVFYFFIIVPPFIRDFFYKLIAKNRYQWFGKKESCRIPTQEELEKFIV